MKSFDRAKYALESLYKQAVKMYDSDKIDEAASSIVDFMSMSGVSHGLGLLALTRIIERLGIKTSEDYEEYKKHQNDDGECL